jgi:hypothetical protein
MEVQRGLGSKFPRATQLGSSEAGIQAHISLSRAPDLNDDKAT